MDRQKGRWKDKQIDKNSYSRDLKISGKYGSGLSCRWALYFWRIFMVGFGAFRVFMRTRLNIEPYSPLKPTKGGFIFIGPNSLSRAKDLVAVDHVTQAVVRV